MIDTTVSEGLALVCLKSPPVNAISFRLLEALRSAVRRAIDQPEVEAIVITGGPKHFSAGADLEIFQEIRSDDDAAAASRTFQEAFQEIEDSPKPVIAAVAGHVLGGALELAMACHFRVADPQSRFSMPEVRLGINPGAGGTQRLPRLVGPEAAIEMLLTGQAIDAQRAMNLGLIDAISSVDTTGATAGLSSSVPGTTVGLPNCVPGTAGQASSGTRPGSADALVACAAEVLRAWKGGSADATLSARRTGRRADKVQDTAVNGRALARAEELFATVRPEIIALRQITEAVRVGLEQSFQAGLLYEQEAFRQCMRTPAAKNKVYVLCASRQTAKTAGPVTASPTRIARAAVVGAGTMGTGIAQALIVAGIATVVCDESEAALSAANRKIQASLDSRVRQGRLTAAEAQQTAGLLITSTDWQPIAGVQGVIEAVFENIEVKRTVIARLEEICSPDTIIASNTSTINLDVLAQRMQHPERLVGMHFFHPAQRMPLVEVIRREATSPDVAAAALQWAKTIGKTPVLVKNREGFLVNRLFIPYLKEAFWLLEEGASPAQIDRVMVKFGFAMGPLVLIDMSGVDILVLTDALMRRAFPHHGALSSIALRLADEGLLGQKTGSGVYRYEKGDHTPHPSDDAGRIIADVRRQRGAAPCDVSDEEITRRLVLRMVAEAFCVLEEGIIQRGSDLDVAMVLGTGLADFRGGVLRYAYDLGLNEVLTQLEELTEKCGPRFSPCRLLREEAGFPSSSPR